MQMLSYWPSAALARDGSATTKSVLAMLQRHSCFLPAQQKHIYSGRANRLHQLRPPQRRAVTCLIEGGKIG